MITGCGKDDIQAVNYEKGLPKEDSPAFKEFMRNEFGFPDDITLRVQDSIYTMMSSQKMEFVIIHIRINSLRIVINLFFLPKKMSQPSCLT